MASPIQPIQIPPPFRFNTKTKMEDETVKIFIAARAEPTRVVSEP